MEFDSIADFLYMGGYYSFVWSAYLITGFSIFWALLLNIKRYKALLRKLHQQNDNLKIHSC